MTDDLIKRLATADDSCDTVSLCHESARALAASAEYSAAPAQDMITLGSALAASAAEVEKRQKHLCSEFHARKAAEAARDQALAEVERLNQTVSALKDQRDRQAEAHAKLQEHRLAAEGARDQALAEVDRLTADNNAARLREDAATERAEQAEGSADDRDELRDAIHDLVMQALAKVGELDGSIENLGESLRRETRYRVLAEDRAEAAEREAAGLREALTPSAETKAAYMGEFKFVFGEYTPNVPWTCIKEIMVAILARAALSKEPEMSDGN